MSGLLSVFLLSLLPAIWVAVWVVVARKRTLLLSAPAALPLRGRLAAVLLVLSPLAAAAAGPVITPALPSVHVDASQKFQITSNGKPVTGGLWYVIGGLQNGAIDQDGTYHAPYSLPSPNVVTIQYWVDLADGAGPQPYQNKLTVTNPVAVISSVQPSTITQVSTPLYIQGNWFLPGSVVTVNGQPVPTTYGNASVLRATATFSNPVSGKVAIGVMNPNPGSTTTTVLLPAAFPAVHYVTPGTLTPGWVTLLLGGTNFTPLTVATLDGRPMQTTFKSATSLTARAYLPAWRGETSAIVGVLPELGSVVTGQQTRPVIQFALSYDTAARFATQAALGPRPSLVDHIQKIGLEHFLYEQVHQPGLAYSDPAVGPRMTLMSAAPTTNSLLRLRLAEAFNAFIPNQAISLDYPSFVPWERKLEADATANYRKLMTDIASDSRLGSFLNLAGNRAPSDPNLHPNQNFAREFLQLFTLGTTLLNDDGTPQLDASGNILPTYDQDTVLDLSRALTGWELPAPVNPVFTVDQIDASQPLAAHDEYHDHGAKILFGRVHLTAGQSTVQDRNAALDAIFAHPNLPPFVSRLLINHLVTSNPSPAYVKRISAVFKDNGRGGRGDLTAVVTAILLDPEARAGDTRENAGDGFLQDPLLFELFLLNTLGQAPTDSQALSIPGALGQDFYFPRSIFDFYPHSFAIPGTTINSPEWSLFNNLSALHRSQYIYGITAGLQPGLQGNTYMANSWLFTAFTNVPDLVDGLNHLLYHGQMSAAEQSTILSYCAGIPDQEQAFTAAVFLALNADSYTISH